MAARKSQRQRIPFGRNSSHFFHIYNDLVEVLTQIRAKDLSSSVLWVSCRLNRSGHKEASPVFAGWVESNDAIDIRVKKNKEFAPVDLRYNDTHWSKLYEDCLKEGPGKLVIRDWGKDKASPGSQEIGVNFYQETHRRSAAITINRGSVGSLNAAFRGDPTAGEDKKIEEILFRWAQEPKSDLVTYIENNLEYSTYSPRTKP